MTAVLFDIDDTLYDQVKPFEDAYTEVFKGRFNVSGSDLFVASRRHSDKVFLQAQNKEISMDEMYIYRAVNSFKDFGVDITAEEALEFQRVYAKNQDSIALSEGMKGMLDYLKKQNVILGVITNGPSRHQRKKAETLGLTAWIPERNIFISADFGLTKPDIEFFELAEKRLGLEKSTTYFIGDSFENDIIGAKRAGWNAVWFNRRKRKAQPGLYRPDCTAETEAELIRIVCDIASRG